jgi:hypothetical protein
VDVDVDVEVDAVAAMLAPPEVGGAGAAVLDELLAAAEHPAASAQQAVAPRSRARLDSPARLTMVRLVAAPAENAAITR